MNDEIIEEIEDFSGEEACENESEEKDFKFAIIITQIVCVIIIIISITVIKFFFDDLYVKVDKWYEKNITVGTDIGEVLDTEEGVSSEI